MKKRKKNPVQIIFFLKGETGKVTMSYSCYLMGLEGVGEILGRFPSIDLKLRNRIYEEYQVLFGVEKKEGAPAELASAITPVAEVQTELPLEEALVSVVNERIVVSSRQIAAHFGKEHKNVLRAIETLECSAEFNRLSFERVDFQDKKGESRPEYMITYEGFSFLVMGFTGKNAAMWKERYIEAFTKMKAQQNEQKQAPVFEIPQTYADALLLAANQAKTIEEQTAQLKEALVSVQNDRAVVSSRQLAAHFEKQHKDVLKAISNLECTPEFNQRNFAPVTFMDKKGEQRPEYLITYEGFSFLVMGFTGKKAIDWKLRYIQNMECTPEFIERNFAPYSYRAANGKENPEYLITRDGFSFLAMGFTGEKAME